MMSWHSKYKLYIISKLHLLIILIIKLYQKTLSFDHGLLRFYYPFGRCRFRPTCSEYAITAIKRYGIINGSRKIIKRLFRCNPWSRGGWDPVK